MNCCGDFSEIYFCHGLGKRVVSVLNDSKSKDERKTGNGLESDRQMLEGTRKIKDPIQFTRRKQKN